MQIAAILGVFAVSACVYNAQRFRLVVSKEDGTVRREEWWLFGMIKGRTSDFQLSDIQVRRRPHADVPGVCITLVFPDRVVLALDGSDAPQDELF